MISPGRLLRGVVGAAACIAVGAVVATRLGAPPEPPSAVTFVTELREAARLETLDVSLHKKITYSPDVQAPDSPWQAVWRWAQESLRPTEGRVIVFAVAHLGVDLEALGAASLRQQGRDVQIVLPPLQARVELMPAETEVIGSNLDSAATAQLLEAARQAFLKEVLADPSLRARAERSTQRALEHFLTRLGLTVTFVPSLSGPGS